MKKIRDLQANSTPFKVIAIYGYEIRLYWTKNRGVNGFQVVHMTYGPNQYFDYGRTKGCGYCKEGAAFDTAIRKINKVPKNHISDHPINEEYFVGGNYYEIPLYDISSADRKKAPNNENLT